jgi:hypothetical protein
VPGMMVSETFGTEIFEPLIKRASSLCCVDNSSPNYGSFDRDFWAYRTIRGFQSGPFQHVMAGFAYLSRIPVRENKSFYLEFAESSLSQWIKQRNLNGSANEWYRNEQSFCATAMGLHSATETLLLIRTLTDPQFFDYSSNSLASSERWLSGRTNHLASNQVVAAACGRWNLGALLDDKRMQITAESVFKTLINDFDRQGFLMEYGGFDFGYSLISLDLLVSTHRAGCDVVLPLVDRICGQLMSLLSRGGDLPFALGSRGTHHRFFGGAHYFAGFSQDASHLVHRLKTDSWSERIKFFMSYDDRYFATFAFSAANRLLAFENNVATKVDPEFNSSDTNNLSPLRREDVSEGTLYCNSKLGSGVQFLTNEGKSFVHLGYSIQFEGEQWCSLSVPKEESAHGVHQFVKQSFSTPLKRFSFLFELLQSLCRIPWIARQVSLWARIKIGRSTVTCPVFLTRSIEVNDETVSIVDLIHSSSEKGFRQIQPLHTFPFYSPSLFYAPETNFVGPLFDSEEFRLNMKSISTKWNIDMRTMQTTSSVEFL